MQSCQVGEVAALGASFDEEIVAAVTTVEKG